MKYWRNGEDINARLDFFPELTQNGNSILPTELARIQWHIFTCYTQNSIYQKIPLTLPKEIPACTFSSPLLLLPWPLPPILLTWITKATSQSFLSLPGFSYCLFSSHQPERSIYVLSQIVSCLLTTLQCFQKMNFTAFISWVHFKWLHSVETTQTPPWPSEKGWCYQGCCVGFTNPGDDVKRRAPHLWGSVSENPSPWLVMRKTSDKPSLGPTLHDTWPALLNTVGVMKSEERVSKTNTD